MPERAGTGFIFSPKPIVNTSLLSGVYNPIPKAWYRKNRRQSQGTVAKKLTSKQMPDHMFEMK